MTTTAFTADIFVKMKLFKWKNSNSFKRKIASRNVATRNRNLVIKVRLGFRNCQKISAIAFIGNYF